MRKKQNIILQTHQLTKRYGSIDVVKNVDLQVIEGKVFGFLGLNGAGKTTTIQMLMGIIQPYSGSFTFFGSPEKRIQMAHKRHIGYVSQNQFFYDWMKVKTLAKFVSAFYPTWDDNEFNKWIELFELPLNKKTEAYSHGMKVKLALTLALSHHPRLLILDEPTAGLDPAARKKFLDLIISQSKKEKRTVFFSTHIIEEIEKTADHVAIIDHGHLKYNGSLRALYKRTRRKKNRLEHIFLNMTGQ